jgi:hypothetical protein
MSEQDLVIKLSIIPISVLIVSIFTFALTERPVDGYHGKEVSISLRDAIFAPVLGTTNYQIKVLVNYTISDPALIGQKLNAVMKVYSANGTIIKTTSFPAGFNATTNGTQQLLTNIPMSKIQNITTVTTFTDLNKTFVMSNPVKTLPLIPLS